MPDETKSVQLDTAGIVAAIAALLEGLSWPVQEAVLRCSYERAQAVAVLMKGAPLVTVPLPAAGAMAQRLGSALPEDQAPPRDEPPEIHAPPAPVAQEEPAPGPPKPPPLNEEMSGWLFEHGDDGKNLLRWVVQAARDHFSSGEEFAGKDLHDLPGAPQGLCPTVAPRKRGRATQPCRGNFGGCAIRAVLGMLAQQADFPLVEGPSRPGPWGPLYHFSYTGGSGK